MPSEITPRVELNRFFQVYADVMVFVLGRKLDFLDIFVLYLLATKSCSSEISLRRELE